MKLEETDFEKISELYRNLLEAEQKLGRMTAKKALLEAKARSLLPRLFDAIDDINKNTSVLSRSLLGVSEDIRKLNKMIGAKYGLDNEFSIDMSTGEINIKTVDTPSEASE